MYYFCKIQFLKNEQFISSKMNNLYYSANWTGHQGFDQWKAVALKIKDEKRAGHRGLYNEY